MNGSVKSCGCLRIDSSKEINKTHGSCKEKEYMVWWGMIARCKYPSNKFYHRYGGRGISVCDRWANSYENFISDMGKRPSKKHSIDRIDNNGNYEPNNCRWTDKLTQANNCSNNVSITINGITKTIPEYARESGLNYMTLYSRIERGCPLEKLLDPVKQGNQIG